MNKTSWIGAFLFTLLLCSELSASISTKDILRKADQARGNIEGVTWKLAVEAEEENRINSMTLEAKARGFDFFSETLAPPKYKGNKIIMIKSNMWFHRPGLSKPVPISKRQRLLGNAAYGDIASTNYAAQYDATEVGEETVSGEICYVFDLKAAEKNTTYDRIKYWISKERLVGIKAEYFTVSDKMFKSAVMAYGNYVTIDGKKQPFISKMIIHDELLSEKSTTLDFTEPDLGKLPDYIFNLNLLRK